jgi:hypothetical protein
VSGDDRAAVDGPALDQIGCVPVKDIKRMMRQRLSAVDGSVTHEQCIPNISPAERRKRLMGGVVTLVLSLAVLAALIAVGADRWWRMALFPLFAGAATGYFQWRDKT